MWIFYQWSIFECIFFSSDFSYTLLKSSHLSPNQEPNSKKYITVTLICLAFLIYQTTKCTYKFIDGKKGTDVSIADASKQTYPAITICPLIIYSENPAYVDNLQKCNLNPQEYFDEAKWVGTGDPAYCKDPANLYEKVVGNASSIIYKIEVDGSTDRGFLASEIESRVDGQMFFCAIT